MGCVAVELVIGLPDNWRVSGGWRFLEESVAFSGSQSSMNAMVIWFGSLACASGGGLSCMLAGRSVGQARDWLMEC